MTKPQLTENDLFWVQNQIKAKFPQVPPRHKRKEYNEFAIVMASHVANREERDEYKGLLDRDDLEFLTTIPRTTIFDVIKRLKLREDASEVKDPNPSRSRGRKRVFYRFQPKN